MSRVPFQKNDHLEYLHDRFDTGDLLEVGDAAYSSNIIRQALRLALKAVAPPGSFLMPSYPA